MSATYKLKINRNHATDVFAFVDGRYRPLTGFLRRPDFNSVLNDMRLADGSVWPIPIVLDIGSDERSDIENADRVELVDANGETVAFIKNPEVYEYCKEEFAKKVFKTLDINHPGVKEVFGMKDYLVGGEIELTENIGGLDLENYLTPAETRQLFKERGWEKVVAFQTRNAPHCSHEYIQKLALDEVDGLFIQPVLGPKKTGDFTDDAILGAYKIAISNYYPSERTHLGVLPLKMRYAGPREAVFHALIRKNFGCTHFIVGRDHAGVGNYYGPYDAQNIFYNFTEKEIGIKIMKFENAFYCHGCAGHNTADKCDHGDESRLLISGTRLREMIRNNEEIPGEFMRPEVADYLINHSNPFVE